jgi:hypothetical protein
MRATGFIGSKKGLLKATIAAPAGGSESSPYWGPIVGELSMIDRGPRSDWCAEPSRDYEEFVGAKKHRDPSRGFMALGP